VSKKTFGDKQNSLPAGIRQTVVHEQFCGNLEVACPRISIPQPERQVAGRYNVKSKDEISLGATAESASSKG